MNGIESFHGVHLCVACMCLWVFACVYGCLHGCAKEWRPKTEIGFLLWVIEAESLICPKDFLVSLILGPWIYRQHMCLKSYDVDVGIQTIILRFTERVFNPLSHLPIHRLECFCYILVLGCSAWKPVLNSHWKSNQRHYLNLTQSQFTFSSDL